MHQRAADADIVHRKSPFVFFADLALRQDDFGSILPEYDAVIFRRSSRNRRRRRRLLRSATSNYRFEELARDGENVLCMMKEGPASLLRRASRIRNAHALFFEAFPPPRRPFAIRAGRTRTFPGTNHEAYDGVLQALKAFETEIAALPNKPEEFINLARRSFELRKETEFLMDPPSTIYVYWMDRRNKEFF